MMKRTTQERTQGIALLTGIFIESEKVGSITECYKWAEDAWKGSKPVTYDECLAVADKFLISVFGEE